MHFCSKVQSCTVVHRRIMPNIQVWMGLNFYDYDGLQPKMNTLNINTDIFSKLQLDSKYAPNMSPTTKPSFSLKQKMQAGQHQCQRTNP